MLKKLPSKLYFNLCRFRKVVHFAQNPCLMSRYFILTRVILGKKLRFLWFSFLNRIKNISIWHQKMEFSFTQSSDILKTPSTLRKWEKVNRPNYSNFGINSRSWKKASTAVTCKPFGLQYLSWA